MKNSESTPRERDVVLDFWRGVSVMFVVLHHAIYFHFHFFRNYYEQAAVQASSFLDQLIIGTDKIFIEIAERSGPYGVKIFFVISGFIITKLLLEEEQKNGRISVKLFYTRRVFRILPAFLFYIISVTLFGLFGLISFSYNELPNTLGFLCNTGLTCSWFIVHTWSLSIEEQFYIFWPLLFFLLPKHYRVQFLSGLIATLLLLSSFGVFIVDEWLNNPLSFACIAVGALCAVSVRFKVYMEKYGLATFIGLLGVLILFHYFLVGDNEIIRQIYRSSIPFVILSIILSTYRLRFFIDTWLFKLFAKIGIISYSLYLWQQVFLAPASQYLKPSFLLVWPLMFAVATFSYLCIEKPILKWAKARLHLKQRPGDITMK